MRESNVHVVPSVAEAAANLFAESARESVAARGKFAVVLSGGSTPLAMYDLLRHDKDLPWKDTFFFWGDERFVPYSHPDSNYGAARARLLDHLPVAESHVHPWPFVPERPQVAADSYAEVLAERLGKPPLFDLVLLGLGEDAHTASLFPGGAALDAEALTVVTSSPSGDTRLSLTPRALSQARVVAFLVSGESKREALLGTLYGERDPNRYPAQAITALERLVWLTDQELRPSG
jgi:6-phosphogluconolactonase